MWYIMEDANDAYKHGTHENILLRSLCVMSNVKAFAHQTDGLTDGWKTRQTQLIISVVVCWLLNVPATCKCISGMDLLRQFYMLPH